MMNGPLWKITPPPPVYAGAYWVGTPYEGIGFKVRVRPPWLHRTLLRVLFGWEWLDELPSKTTDQHFYVSKNEEAK